MERNIKILKNDVHIFVLLYSQQYAGCYIFVWHIKRLTQVHSVTANLFFFFYHQLFLNAMISYLFKNNHFYHTSLTRNKSCTYSMSGINRSLPLFYLPIARLCPCVSHALVCLLTKWWCVTVCTVLNFHCIQVKMKAEETLFPSVPIFGDYSFYVMLVLI